MSAVNRGLRQASRQLRLPQRFSQTSALRPLSSRCAQFARPTVSSTLNRNTFSTMASLQSANTAAPSPSEGKGYDPEITDIANYVHNKPIDSELAVSHSHPLPPHQKISYPKLPRPNGRVI